MLERTVIIRYTNIFSARQTLCISIEEKGKKYSDDVGSTN